MPAVYTSTLVWAARCIIPVRSTGVYTAEHKDDVYMYHQGGRNSNHEHKICTYVRVALADHQKQFQGQPQRKNSVDESMLYNTRYKQYAYKKTERSPVRSVVCSVCHTAIVV